MENIRELAISSQIIIMEQALQNIKTLVAYRERGKETRAVNPMSVENPQDSGYLSAEQEDILAERFGLDGTRDFVSPRDREMTYADTATESRAG